MPVENSLFDEGTLRKLARLRLVASRVRAGTLRGERRSTRMGESIEFADYRRYTPGDDLRRLDWKAYARLDRPFLKLFEEEEDLSVHVLIDASESMDWGEADEHKFRYALRLAAALGAVALSAGDRFQASLLHGPQSEPEFGPVRGEQNIVRMLNFLSAQKSAGTTDLNRALRSYGLAPRRPGLVFLISDLLAPSGFLDGITLLQSRGYEAAVLHILSLDEIDPPLAGDLRLLDVETGEAREVTIDGSMRTLYKERVASWRDEIERTCRGRGIRYLGIITEQPWDVVMMLELRKTGIIR